MTKPITISFDRYQDNEAPLFHRYPGQVNPQPAYVTLDLETGEVDAQASGEVGNAMPADVWHGVVRRYPIRGDLTKDQVVEALEGIKGTLQTILDNSEVKMVDTNWTGKLNEAGEDAERELPELIGADLEGRVITHLAHWLTESGEDAWLPEPNQSIPEFVSQVTLSIKSDGWEAAEDVEEVLMTLWEDRLYNGDPLPVNVATTLLADGRCDDSQWVAELEAYAEGRDPDEDENPGPRLG